MIASRRTLLTGLAAWPAVIALPRLAHAQDRAARAGAALDAAFVGGPPAMAAAVVGPQGLIWSGVRGVRRAGGDEPATLDQRWHLGSNGKAMTAVLYGRLVEQGRAPWGATLQTLFPDAAIDPALAPVTIDDLLCHRSGLLDRDILSREVLMAGHQDQRSARDQRSDFADIVLGKPPTGPRGTFAYGNVNYTLAGAAIERLTGQPWEEVMAAELFTPLGMTSVGHGAPQGENPWGHRMMGDQLAAVDPARGADNPAFMGPAGRMHMTVADYARFLSLYLSGGGGAVRPGTLAHLLTPPEGPPPAYAYGWGLQAGQAWAAGGPALAHEGSNTMWHAIARVAPQRGLAVLSLANERTRGAPANQALAQALIDIHAPA
ncbi:serine hydrolase domain-containing protein [Brevundimonas sp.]|uniref:serine hydrolase domain-containing protein n=1 Tax=Brevundimonas sp. TaxID=1871086 RepID=UPI002FC6D4A3